MKTAQGSERNLASRRKSGAPCSFGSALRFTLMPEVRGTGLCPTTSEFITELRRKHCFHPHQKLQQSPFHGFFMRIFSLIKKKKKKRKKTHNKTIFQSFVLVEVESWETKEAFAVERPDFVKVFSHAVIIMKVLSHQPSYHHIKDHLTCSESFGANLDAQASKKSQKSLSRA